jgi:uncharacterized protein with PIN domain
MAEEKKASQVQVKGNWLKCPVCGGELFWQKEAQLNTRVMTLLDLDWVNPRGICYICDNCRHILWFYGDDEKL